MMKNKSLFKKKRKQTSGRIKESQISKNIRRTSSKSESDDDEGNEAELHDTKNKTDDETSNEKAVSSSTTARILDTKRKRTMKRQLMQVGSGGIIAASSEAMAPVSRTSNKRHRTKTNSNTNELSDTGEQNPEREEEEEELSNIQGAKVQEGLRGTFSNAKLGDKNNIPGNDDSQLFGEGVLGQKHRAAMEEFIQRQLAEKEGTIEASAMKEKGIGSLSSVDSKEKRTEEVNLFREVAASMITRGEDAAGNPLNSLSSEIGHRDPSSNPAAISSEGDVGSGGTMLGGTGIAEVILPVEERISTVRATQEAVARRLKLRQSRGQTEGRSQRAGLQQLENASGADLQQACELPTSFSSGPAKRQQRPVKQNQSSLLQLPSKNSSSADFARPEDEVSGATVCFSATSAGKGILKSDVEAVSASYAHNYQLHKQEWALKRDQERLDDERSRLQSSHKPIGTSQGRVGFAASRGRTDGSHSVANTGTTFGGEQNRNPQSSDGKTHTAHQNGGRHQSDDVLWRTFVKNQRERSGNRR